MLKQIVKGEKYIAVKYHGQVKLIVFECNNCHKEFEKPESYYRKQLKTRQFACCFCSPGCRSTYYSKNSVTGVKTVTVQPSVQPVSVETPQVKKGGFFDSFKKLFSS